MWICKLCKYIIGYLYLYSEHAPDYTLPSHISRNTLFLTEERLSIYFTGLTPGIHDSLDVKTSKLAFKTKSERKRRGGSSEVFPVGGECKKRV